MGVHRFRRRRNQFSYQAEEWHGVLQLCPFHLAEGPFRRKQRRTGHWRTHRLCVPPGVALVVCHPRSYSPSGWLAPEKRKSKCFEEANSLIAISINQENTACVYETMTREKQNNAIPTSQPVGETSRTDEYKAKELAIATMCTKRAKLLRSSQNASRPMRRRLLLAPNSLPLR